MTSIPHGKCAEYNKPPPKWYELSASWIVLIIMKDTFTFSIISKILFNRLDQIHNGATLHVACHIQSIPCLLMPWRLEKQEHQWAWYWSSKQEYSSLVSEELMVHGENMHIYIYIKLLTKSLSFLHKKTRKIETASNPVLWAKIV